MANQNVALVVVNASQTALWLNPLKLADVDEALERTLNANGYTNGSTHQNGTARKASPVKKIDWEIPRKVHHSSIGTLCDSIHLLSPS